MKHGNGETYAVETNDDGSEIVKEVIGQRRVGQRISTFIEVLPDDTEQGADRLLESIEWLKQQVEKRKARNTQRKRKKRVRSGT